MKKDLEKIKKAKGRTYINVEDCPIPICVDDYLEYKKIEEELGIDLLTLAKKAKSIEKKWKLPITAIEKIIRYDRLRKTFKVWCLVNDNLQLSKKGKPKKFDFLYANFELETVSISLSLGYDDEKYALDACDFFFKDYGKTWALKREELIDEN